MKCLLILCFVLPACALAPASPDRGVIDSIDEGDEVMDVECIPQVSTRTGPGGVTISTTNWFASIAGDRDDLPYVFASVCDFEWFYPPARCPEGYTCTGPVSWPDDVECWQREPFILDNRVTVLCGYRNGEYGSTAHTARFVLSGN